MKKNSGKAPSIQWYFKDWLCHARLHLCSFEAKGVWADLISISCTMPTPGMFADENGPLKEEEILLLLSGKMAEKKRGFEQLKQRNLIKKLDDGTYYVKRVYHDIKLRQTRRKAGKQGGNPLFELGKSNPYYKTDKQNDNQSSEKGDNQKDNQKITPSTSTSSPNKKYIKSDFLVMFESARQLYPGTKRGLETEFENFTKKHKDWKKVIGLLESAIKNQIEQRKADKSRKLFVPHWKHFKTWINNRCWEEHTGRELIPEQQAEKEQWAIESERQKMRSDYSSYYREKTVDELRALLSDKNNPYRITHGWLIREIIAKKEESDNSIGVGGKDRHNTKGQE